MFVRDADKPEDGVGRWNAFVAESRDRSAMAFLKDGMVDACVVVWNGLVTMVTR